MTTPKTSADYLYKNASFMAAFDYALEQGSTPTYHGREWKIDNRPFPANAERINCIRALMRKMIDALHQFFSCDYRKRFKVTVEAFNQAFAIHFAESKKLPQTIPTVPMAPKEIDIPPLPVVESTLTYLPLSDVPPPSTEETKTLSPLATEETKIATTPPIVEKIALSKISQAFLNRLGALSSAQMQQLWTGILTNLSQQFGVDVIENAQLKQDTFILTFKEQIYFWMPTTDENGDLSPTSAPQGGILFTFGDSNRQLRFKATKDGLKKIEGWQAMTRLPLDMPEVFMSIAKKVVGDWPNADTREMKIANNVVTTRGGVDIRMIPNSFTEKELNKPFLKTLANWSTLGEIVPFNDPLEVENHMRAFLARKREECGFKG